VRTIVLHGKKITASDQTQELKALGVEAIRFFTGARMREMHLGFMGRMGRTFVADDDARLSLKKLRNQRNSPEEWYADPP
jgi:hypothetical protein